MDNLFKALLIIILVAFLYLYYESSNTDRYFYIQKGGIVFDKKTGTRYSGHLDVDRKVRVTSMDIINGTKRVYTWRDINIPED